MPKKLTAKQRSRMTPEEIREFENHQLWVKEKKAAWNKANYAKNREEILAKKKTEREENREAYNERHRKYNAANRDKINVIEERYRNNVVKRKEAALKRKEEEKKLALQQELEELRKKYPYETYQGDQQSVLKMGGRLEPMEKYSGYFTCCLPKNNNRFWCEKMELYYEYTGSEKIDKEFFFTNVVKHDTCLNVFHLEHKRRHEIYEA